MQKESSKCVELGCGKRAKAHDLCPRHYNCWLRVHNRPCSIDTCGRPVAASDLCSMHWQRKSRTGDPVGLRRHIYGPCESAADFWARALITADNERCWIRAGPFNDDGYGQVTIDGKPVLAHRYSWCLANGYECPLHVLHTCDTRPCINPRHLYSGTHQQNMLDRNLRHPRYWRAREVALTLEKE